MAVGPDARGTQLQLQLPWNRMSASDRRGIVAHEAIRECSFSLTPEHLRGCLRQSERARARLEQREQRAACSVQRAASLWARSANTAPGSNPALAQRIKLLPYRLP
jgi:hypothetical protein